MKKNNNIGLFEKNLNEKILKQNVYDKLVYNNFDTSDNVETKDDKLISVIIPTYNRREQLCQCLDSILRQSYKNFEVIIVDDGSKDDTETYIKENYKDKVKFYKNEKNSGAGFSRRSGYSKSNGDYIIFCDDDDYYLDDDFFYDVVNIFKDTSYHLICSNSYIHYEAEDRYAHNKLNFETGLDTIEYLKGFQFSYIKPNSTFTTVFRKDILEKNKFEEMQMVNDSSIYLRSLVTPGKVYVNDSIIGVYRVHSKNISFNIKAPFLIENLEEKKKIYNIIKENNYFNADNWFKEQIILTVEYFLNGIKVQKEDKDLVFDWISNNYNNSSIIFKELKKYQKKKNIYKIAKKIVKPFRG